MALREQLGLQSEIAHAVIDRFHKLYSGPWKIVLVASGMWAGSNPLFFWSSQLESLVVVPEIHKAVTGTSLWLHHRP